jgi:glycosyltransferase involved in cell wall biosynthesis
MFELSIIIPTKDDADVLERCLASLHAVMLHESITVEAFIVDDASTDGTVDLAVKLSSRFPELHMRILQRSSVNPGFGAMVRFACRCEGTGDCRCDRVLRVSVRVN